MLLPYRRPPFRTKLNQFYNAKLRDDLLLEIELLLLAFATGIGDVTTWSEYRVFTANHTGNTLLFAVSVTEKWGNIPTDRVIPVPIQLIAVSLFMFLLAGSISGQLGNLVGCRKRWWLIATNTFQFLLIFVASMIQAHRNGWTSGPRTSAVEIDFYSGCVVALLAFSAGSQVAVARSLPMTEITTANTTSAYVDLLIDRHLFQPHNRRRNRRLSFLFCLLAGSFVGGFVYQVIGSPKTLFISAMGKFLVSILLFFNRGGYPDNGSGYPNNGTVTRQEDDSLRSTSVNYADFCYEEKATSPIIHAMSKKDDRLLPLIDSYSTPRNSQVYISIPSWAITTTGYGY